VASVVNPVLPYAFNVAEDSARKALCSHVARLLREERQRQELSMNVLAERAGLSRQMVSYIEQEERNPTLDTLLRLTAVLGVKLEDMLAHARKAAAKPKK
jgi:transcriptional regulator with XRE-family HTH domain